MLIGCGGKSDETKTKKDDAGPGAPTVAPIAIPTTGVDGIKRMNYQWGSEGSKEYAKALTSCCAKGKAKDWAATRSHAEAALAKDSYHIGAHWLLGVALSQTGEPAAAVEHLVHAIASDFGRYGENLAKEADLAPFLATKHGTAVVELTTKIRDDYRKRATAGLLVIARRSTFRWPEKPGVQGSSSRGELYAYDRETQRYLRLTHTDDEVAGFVRAPSGSTIAVLGFEKIDRPKGDDPTPLITRAFVFELDTTEWKAGPRATINAAAREVSVGYGAGDQLLVATAAATGRWGVAAPEVASVDRATGKLTKLAAPVPSPRIVLSLEEGRVVRTAEGVKAAWTGDPPTAANLEVGGKQIGVRESGVAAQSSIAVAGTYVAFATAVDPCAPNAAPSLYVADTKSTPATFKHVLTAKSRFSTRWLPNTTLLAYEDGDGAIRIWDAGTGQQTQKLDNKPGLALDVLSLAPAPLCKQAPPSADTGSGSADEAPLPPEDGSGGPVVAPQ
ncbi:MAG: hypothetical protein ABI867_37140 [Kofleriaceae bacterium]